MCRSSDIIEWVRELPKRYTIWPYNRTSMIYRLLYECIMKIILTGAQNWRDARYGPNRSVIWSSTIYRTHKLYTYRFVIFPFTFWYNVRCTNRRSVIVPHCATASSKYFSASILITGTMQTKTVEVLAYLRVHHCNCFCFCFCCRFFWSHCNSRGNRNRNNRTCLRIRRTRTKIQFTG